MAIGIGIALEPSSIRGAVIERSGKLVRLLAASDAPCETSNAEAVSQAITQLRRTLRISRPVVLGVPSTSTIIATLEPLVTAPARAQLAVQFELQQQLPFSVADAAWHYEWLSTNGRRAATGASAPASSLRPGPRAVAAAIRRPILDERLTACRRAGVSVMAVAITPLGILNALAINRPLAAGPVVLLRLHDDGVSAEWILWTGTSFHAIPIISASSQTLVEDLFTTWETVQAQQPNLPTHLQMIATASVAERLQPLLSARAGWQIELVDPRQIVSAGSAQSEQPAQFIAAIGLALQGVGLARLPLNLLAAGQAQARAGRLRQGAWVASLVCLLAVLGLGASGMLELRQRRLHVLQAVEQQARLYHALRPQVRALIQRQQRIEQRSAQLSRLSGDSLLLGMLLIHVADALPDTMWLTSFECSQGAAGALDGIIQGRAKSFQDATQFLDRLKTVAGMTSAKPLSTSVATDPATGKEVVAFSIQVQRALAAAPKPADAEEPSKPSASRMPGARPARKDKEKEKP